MPRKKTSKRTPWLNIPAAAEALGVTRKTVAVAIERGQLAVGQRFRAPGGKVHALIHEDVVSAFKARRARSQKLREQARSALVGG